MLQIRKFLRFIASARVRGFTIVEMLLVMVVIGVLSGIALLHVNNVHESVYRAAMKNDLRNYASMEESRRWTGDNTGYLSKPDSLAGFRYSPHVSTSLALGDSTMWWLVVKHDETKTKCLWGHALDDRVTPPSIVCSDVNLPPIAMLSATPRPVRIGAPVTFSANGSMDPDGFVATYGWDFGDGASAPAASAPSVQHSYATRGTYSATVTATDALGATGQVSASVVVDGPPVARFTVSPLSGALVAGRVASFSGTTSTDVEGPIAAYAWDFGALGTAATPTADVRFPVAGTFNPSLTVTDAIGNTNSATAPYVVAANNAPIASFTVSDAIPPVGQSVTFDGTGSSDSDGSVAAYSWDFGDGTTGTGSTATHSYSAAGTFSATLTVTDDLGATGTATRSLSPNSPPVADFTMASTVLSGVDASVVNTSHDPDAGQAITYSWNFGDGTTATTVTPAKTFSTPGTYTVSLLVTDPYGLTSTASHSVTVTNRPPSAPSVTCTPASGPTGSTATCTASGSTDPDGGTIVYQWSSTNRVGSPTGPTASYTLTSPGTVNVTVAASDGQGGTSPNASSSVVFTNRPPSAPTVSCSPTSVPTGTSTTCTASGSVDPDGGTVSYTWTATGLVSSSGASAVYSWPTPRTGVAGASASDGQGGTSAVASANVTVTNRPPTATFSVDATSKSTGSGFVFTPTASDPDGGVISYSWNFGDAGTSTATNPVHAYTTPGSYNVTLTVTDGQGGGYTTPSQALTATNRAPSAPTVTCTPTSTPTGTTATCTASGSSDADGGSISYQQWSATGRTGAATGTSTTYSLSTPGSISVTAVASDGQGGLSSASSAASVTFTNRSPSVGTTTCSPMAVLYGSSFTCSTSGWSDPDGGTLTYRFTLMDGSYNVLGNYDTGATASYVFSRGVGSYYVLGQAADNQGSGYVASSRIGPVTVSHVAPTVSASVSPSPATTGSTVTYTASATVGTCGSLSYNWSFSDGGSAQSGSSATRSYGTPGPQSATVTVSGICGSASSSASVAVNLPLAANFSVTTASPTVNANTGFDGSSSSPGGYINSYSWDYGDFTSGSGITPVHTYIANGTYSVQLTTSGSGGYVLPSSATKSVQVVQVGWTLVGGSNSINNPDGSGNGGTSAYCAPSISGGTTSVFYCEVDLGIWGGGFNYSISGSQNTPVSWTYTDKNGTVTHPGANFSTPNLNQCYGSCPAQNASGVLSWTTATSNLTNGQQITVSANLRTNGGAIVPWNAVYQFYRY